MRIDNNIPSISIGGSDAAKRSDRADGDKSAQADSIELSNIGLSAAASHTDKIEQLRVQVASGAYHPSAEEVAGSIIDEMQR